MTPSYQRWQVRGYTRPRMDWTADGEPFHMEGEPDERVTVVFDPRGWRWEVTTEPDERGREQVRSLTVFGGKVDQEALRAVPLRDLADAAAGHWAKFDANRADGMDMHTAHVLARAESGQVRLPGDPPHLHEFAAAWHETPARTIVEGESTARRDALAVRFGVTVHAVDKWTRAARDAGLIEPAGVGRPRNPKTPEGNRRRANRKKEQTP